MNKKKTHIEGPNEQNEQIKVEKIEVEKNHLLKKVLNGSMTTTREKVAYILNHHSKARNSDTELAWVYWKTFETDVFNGSMITKPQLHKLSKISSLSRARAKIQNEYKLFQADDTVKKYRGVLEEEKKNEAIEDKPFNPPIYSVFIDETGKTQPCLAVGSLWVIDGGLSTYKTHNELLEWKKKKDISYEFHFSKVTAHKLQVYKDFILKFLGLNPTIGFKVIIINRSGLSDTNKAITDLTFHLVNKGIQHESTSGRAPLPRMLQIWLDEDEKGSDTLKLENIRERIISQKIDGLYLGDFEAVDSTENHYIQMVDLFTGSINRRINNYGDSGHFKDQLADFVLNLLQFDIQILNKENSDIDKSIVFNLSYESGEH